MLKNRMSYDEFTHKIRYAKHLEELKRRKSTIDNKPFLILTASGYGMWKMKQDSETERYRQRMNRKLIQKISKIVQRPISSTYYRSPRQERFMSRINLNILKQEEIERRNFTIGCKLANTKSRVDSRNSLYAHKAQIAPDETIKISPQVLFKYSQIVLPQEARMLKKLLRPKIYLEPQQNDQKFDRIVIQLFTEACPLVVLEFVRMCVHFANASKKAFKFIRIFSNLWIEGELKFTTSELRNPGFEYDMNIVNHAHGPGVLSFAKCYLDGFKHGLINYSISFRPLAVLNGVRVPFGLVTRGLRSLNCLQTFGTKNGKTTKEITIIRCGMCS